MENNGFSVRRALPKLGTSRILEVDERGQLLREPRNQSRKSMVQTAAEPSSSRALGKVARNAAGPWSSKVRSRGPYSLKRSSSRTGQARKPRIANVCQSAFPQSKWVSIALGKLTICSMLLQRR